MLQDTGGDPPPQELLDSMSLGLEVTFKAPCPDLEQLGIAVGPAQAGGSDRPKGQPEQGEHRLSEPQFLPLENGGVPSLLEKK